MGHITVNVSDEVHDALKVRAIRERKKLGLMVLEAIVKLAAEGSESSLPRKSEEPTTCQPNPSKMENPPTVKKENPHAEYGGIVVGKEAEVKLDVFSMDEIEAKFTEPPVLKVSMSNFLDRCKELILKDLTAKDFSKIRDICDYSHSGAWSAIRKILVQRIIEEGYPEESVAKWSFRIDDVFQKDGILERLQELGLPLENVSPY